MRYFSLILCCILVGCFYVGQDRFSDIIQRPPSTWSNRDCLTVVLAAMHHNYFDQNSPNIKVMAMPYTPWVVMALNRLSQSKQRWSDTEYEHQLDAALKGISGLYLDWDVNHFVDSRGNYLRNVGQLDSLLFMVTLRNNSWPCNVPVISVPISSGGQTTYKDAPLLSPVDYPCYIPDITDLDARIYIETDNGLTIKPRVVWGRKRNLLTLEETLLVMFPLRSGTQHLFDKTGEVYLVLKGFDAKIRFTFSMRDLLTAIGETTQPTAAR